MHTRSLMHVVATMLGGSITGGNQILYVYHAYHRRLQPLSREGRSPAAHESCAWLHRGHQSLPASCETPSQRSAACSSARQRHVTVRAAAEAPPADAEASPAAAAPSLTTCRLENLLNTQVLGDATNFTRILPTSHEYVQRSRSHCFTKKRPLLYDLGPCREQLTQFSYCCTLMRMPGCV